MYVAKYTDVDGQKSWVTRTTYAQSLSVDGTVSIPVDAKIQVNIAHFFYREMLFNRRRW